MQTVSVETQFVHRLSDIRSHLLFVFRHWSQARVLLLFLDPVSSSEISEFKWDILHLVRQAEEESASWSWGGKRRPESRWLGLIKPYGTYLLDCEDHDAGLSTLVLAYGGYIVCYL